MTRWTALLLLAALAAAATVKTVSAGATRGGPDMWQCGNGEWIDARRRCDGGTPDCPDGTDEVDAMCDKAPSIRLQAGQVTTVRVQFKAEFHAVEFHLCDAASCSRLWLWGSNADGAMKYIAKTGCNGRGRDCSERHEGRPDVWLPFREGPLVFKAELRAGELAVWLDGHQGKAATVPVKEGSDLLRVRPTYWTSDLPVEFGRN